jgi:hypothetical protein
VSNDMQVDVLALREEGQDQIPHSRHDIQIGAPVDTFSGAGGESKARLFEVYGYAFLARKRK